MTVITSRTQQLAQVARDTRVWPDSAVLLDEDFRDGLGGFETLVNGYVPQGPVTWDPHYHGGALVLNTGDQSDSVASPGMAESMAIRRIGREAANSDESIKLMLEIWWGFTSRWGVNYLGNIEFGIDQADSAGNRSFAKFRWWNVNPAVSGAYRDARWAFMTGTDASPTYSYLPGPDSGTISSTPFTNNIQTLYGFNESKRNRFYFAGIFDCPSVASGGTGVICDGLQVGHRQFGSLAGLAPGSNPLRAYSTTYDSLTTFEQGLNVAVNLRNRSDVSYGSCRVYLSRVRVTVIPTTE